MFCRIGQDHLTPGPADRLGERLRRLPEYAPPAGGWERLQRRRSRPRRWAMTAGGGLALAASLLLAVGLWPQGRSPQTPNPGAFPARNAQVAQLIRTSQQLERRLARVRPQVDVWDSVQEAQAQRLEKRLALLDLQLNYADSAAAERLWRDRVTLMNALVDLHQEPAAMPGLRYASYQY